MGSSSRKKPPIDLRHSVVWFVEIDSAMDGGTGEFSVRTMRRGLHHARHTAVAHHLLCDELSRLDLL